MYTNHLSPKRKAWEYYYILKARYTLNDIPVNRIKLVLRRQEGIKLIRVRLKCYYLFIYRMRLLEKLENPRTSGRAIGIHVANELYVRSGKYGVVFDKMVSERSRILSIRAERISTDSCIPDAWHHSRR